MEHFNIEIQGNLIETLPADRLPAFIQMYNSVADRLNELEEMYQLHHKNTKKEFGGLSNLAFCFAHPIEGHFWDVKPEYKSYPDSEDLYKRIGEVIYDATYSYRFMH